MGKKCAVAGCCNRNRSVSLHVFPNEPILLKKWVDFCGNPRLTDAADDNLLLHRRICSAHFTKESFFDPTRFSKGLRKGAFPSIKMSDDSSTPMEDYFDVEYLEEEEEEYSDSSDCFTKKTKLEYLNSLRRGIIALNVVEHLFEMATSGFRKNSRK
ncbi:52 kDa repressor of the inhibitor of the protein kinase-like [Wyeomyia smithii]|uniref:52 kDa repressor of the inhibitor of the protein kinase-like n=1 Tax=Wyeomyia smithii TaxID=174621 RepID=UPI002467E807|nr:52 kDa repressor of the inhibitor of the protein kinase-like [Wyeomyia smithii]